MPKRVANPAGITLKLEGLPHTRRVFVELEGRVRKRILRKAVRAGGAPVVKALRGHVRRSASDTGWFGRNVAQKVKMYPSGRAVAVIGAKRAKDPVTGRNPFNYDHLAERGAKPHYIPGPVLITLRNGSKILLPAINHPGATPRRVFEKADREARSKGERAFASKLAIETNREAAELARQTGQP